MNENNINENNINRNNRMSNMDRLRLLLSGDDFNPNDFSLLGQLDQNNNESMLKGLTTSQLEIIPTKILNQTLEVECTICLLPHQTNDEIRVLPCQHKYHVECIDLWLNRRAHCPMCKTPISVELAREIRSQTPKISNRKMAIKVNSNCGDTLLVIDEQSVAPQ